MIFKDDRYIVWSNTFVWFKPYSKIFYVAKIKIKVKELKYILKLKKINLKFKTKLSSLGKDSYALMQKLNILLNAVCLQNLNNEIKFKVNWRQQNNVLWAVIDFDLNFQLCNKLLSSLNVFLIHCDQIT